MRSVKSKIDSESNLFMIYKIQERVTAPVGFKVWTIMATFNGKMAKHIVFIAVRERIR